MLVLTRSIGQKIKVGDDITITVVDTDKDMMDIGLDVPSGVEVLDMEGMEEKSV